MNSDKTFFGHPRGLATLFFTEMWERFSYYGMRALLLLFMVATIEEGGMGLDEKTGGAIYGLYTMLVYLLAVPGGWLADRLFGLRQAVFYGGCIIALGHFCMAIPMTETFFLGLLLIVMGTGLLKPNISGMVGELYSNSIEDQARRDSGFSIFYMGINIGATISPFITGYLGEKWDWHYGFAAAGVGMVLGLIQYKATEKYLGNAGIKTVTDTVQNNGEKNVRIGLWIFLLLLAVFVVLLFTKTIVLNPITVAQASAYVIGVCAALYFIYILTAEKLGPAERKKIIAIMIFFVATTFFYGAYEQQGSSLNLFAKRYTDMFIGSFEMPASWMQSVPAGAVLVFTPLFAWLWIWLERRKLNPSTPVKMSLGLIFMGLAYAVMVGASLVVVGGHKALPTWLIVTYIFNTFGEICLYPIGLSAVTKLSPKRLLGQMMGVFFMSLSLGNLFAGLFGGEFDKDAIEANPNLLVDLFGLVMKTMLIAGVIALVLSKPIRKLMGDIR